MPLFELGSLYHDYYLLNIRLPSDTNKNQGLGHVVDLWLTVSNEFKRFMQDSYNNVSNQ